MKGKQVFSAYKQRGIKRIFSQLFNLNHSSLVYILEKDSADINVQQIQYLPRRVSAASQRSGLLIVPLVNMEQTILI